MPKQKLTKLEKQVISDTAELAYYAAAWAHGSAEDDTSYIAGGVEAAAHMVACVIVQRLGLAKDGCETGFTRDALKLDDPKHVTKAKIQKHLERYVIRIKKEEGLI